MNTLLSSKNQKSTLESLPAKIDNPSYTAKMAHYQADQQVKYLYLQAEIEVLLNQLQTLKQQKYLSQISQS